mmetsp:Transcript_81214/g.161073  ORF Transcript_81214/g.161073 Transcript_81214/m.161073 type:complete len:254 (+) Transcript_81214:710-1471(+)
MLLPATLDAHCCCCYLPRLLRCVRLVGHNLSTAAPRQLDFCGRSIKPDHFCCCCRALSSLTTLDYLLKLRCFCLATHSLPSTSTNQLLQCVTATATVVSTTAQRIFFDTTSSPTRYIISCCCFRHCFPWGQPTASTMTRFNITCSPSSPGIICRSLSTGLGYQLLDLCARPFLCQPTLLHQHIVTAYFWLPTETIPPCRRQHRQHRVLLSHEGLDHCHFWPNGRHGRMQATNSTVRHGGHLTVPPRDAAVPLE